MRTAGLGMLNRSSWISPYDPVSAAIQTDDPMLPRQLLPKGWPAEAAREAVSALQKNMKSIAATAAGFSTVTC